MMTMTVNFNPFSKKKYYWISALIEGRHTLIYPPYESEHEARTKGFEKLQGILFEIFSTDTKDQGKATQQYRMHIVESSNNKYEGMAESLERMKHKI